VTGAAPAAAAFVLLSAATLLPSARQQVDCDVEDLNTPCPLADGATTERVIRQQGGRHYYWFGAPVPDMHLRVELVDLPADYDLYLFSDQSRDPSVPFAQSANLELAPEVIDMVLADQGTYLLEVVSDPGQPFDPSAPYTLRFALTAPPTPTPTEPPVPTPTATPEPRAVVPPILYRGGGAAANEVRAAGLVPRITTADRFSPAGPGSVAVQDPPAGSVVAPDSVVDIIVASGNVEVPPVTGLSEQAAQDLLQASGFKTETRRTRNSTVAVGLAIGTDPNVGQVVPSETTLVLFISRGD